MNKKIIFSVLISVLVLCIIIVCCIKNKEGKNEKNLKAILRNKFKKGYDNEKIGRAHV